MESPRSKKLKELLKTLSQDPKIKLALDELKTKAKGDAVYSAKSFLDLVVYVLKLSVGFLGKRKARAVVEIVEALGFLITISLIVKRNLFDRPEVRAYFFERWKNLRIQVDKVLDLSSKYVRQRLKVLKKNSEP